MNYEIFKDSRGKFSSKRVFGGLEGKMVLNITSDCYIIFNGYDESDNHISTYKKENADYFQGIYFIKYYYINYLFIESFRYYYQM